MNKAEFESARTNSEIEIKKIDSFNKQKQKREFLDQIELLNRIATDSRKEIECLTSCIIDKTTKEKLIEYNRAVINLVNKRYLEIEQMLNTVR